MFSAALTKHYQCCKSSTSFVSAANLHAKDLFTCTHSEIIKYISGHIFDQFLYKKFNLMMIIIIIYQTTRPQKGASQSALASSSQVTHQGVVNYNNKKMHGMCRVFIF